MQDNTNLGSFNPELKQKNAKDTFSQNYSADIIKLHRRVKVVEEGLSNLRRKILVNEHNDLSRHKKAIIEGKTTMSEINDLKIDVDNIKITMKEFIGELRSSARREDVKILKKYVDMWDPMSFVTIHTVEEVVEEKLHELLTKKAAVKKKKE